MSDRDRKRILKELPGPSYWRAACQELAERDPVLAGLVETHGGDVLRGSGDAFRTMVNAVVGQQISVAAAEGIWKRLTAAFPEMSPRAFTAASLEELRATGLSWRKSEYIQGIAEAFTSGDLDDTVWSEWSDTEIHSQLTRLRGIGPWTADMVLIFHLQRPDILPLGDIGLVNAAANLYAWETDGAETNAAKLAARREQLAVHAETWRPWRTVATWFIWRDLDAEPVIY
ncbi:MAG: DNA-3-methyladenine glycosylase 2 family protein [Spirochaetaceae bacterium]|nr:MAG: DNA-3-methyladenine glycosylase 2 family protein [Spirochaetaceae bacterium]